MILTLFESIFEIDSVVHKIHTLDIHIRVPPADDSVEVCSKVYPGISKIVVTGLLWDILLSEIHNMCTFAVNTLRNIFRSSMYQESEDWVG